MNRAPWALLLAAAVGMLVLTADAHNIMDFGAIPSNETFAAAEANGYALYAAAQAAHKGQGGDRDVVVPGGVFTMVPYQNMDGLYDVRFELDGELRMFSGDTALWPNFTDSVNRLPLIGIYRSSKITLTSRTGNGTISGHGLHWWWQNILYQTKRPNMVHMESCIDTVFERWTLLNSPRYHVKWVDMVNGLVQDIKIEVDVNGQKQLLKQAGRLDATGIPTFPLNTDGIDVRGHNITVRRCHVENFDDSLCVKPQNGRGNLTQCSTDIVFEDSTVTNGVGASVGSVPPDPNVNCIRNVIFRRINFNHPLKAIYVKPNPCPNPATDGTGVVDNILYEDIYAWSPLWWSIWVSTQQQHQPGAGADTGCSFLFPLPGHKCPTQPCVPVTNLKLRNIYMENAALSAGILRCNELGPCTGWEWTNVTILSRTNWPVGNSFLCQAVENATWVNVTPGCTDHMPTLT